MAHIQLTEGLPGIRGLFAFRPETAKPLCELGDVLLHQPNSLSAADRELIATYVSSPNDCFYCQTSHGAIAAYHLGGDESLVAEVKNSPGTAAISDKLKALLVIAGKVHREHLEDRLLEFLLQSLIGGSGSVLEAAERCLYLDPES